MIKLFRPLTNCPYHPFKDTRPRLLRRPSSENFINDLWTARTFKRVQMEGLICLIRTYKGTGTRMGVEIWTDKAELYELWTLNNHPPSGPPPHIWFHFESSLFTPMSRKNDNVLGPEIVHSVGIGIDKPIVEVFKKKNRNSKKN